ncbi:hypothetical protein JAAARDRAFT_37050, partial [Jaapia argillacea MUCL 33604]
MIEGLAYFQDASVPKILVMGKFKDRRFFLLETWFYPQAYVSLPSADLFRVHRIIASLAASCPNFKSLVAFRLEAVPFLNLDRSIDHRRSPCPHTTSYYPHHQRRMRRWVLVLCLFATLCSFTLATLVARSPSIPRASVPLIERVATNPLRSLLMLRQSCPADSTTCNTTAAQCCPTGDDCCQAGGCCSAGTTCYGPACCPVGTTGCQLKSCCIASSTCCSDGECCPFGSTCGVDSGKTGCCDVNGVCRVPASAAPSGTASDVGTAAGTATGSAPVVTSANSQSTIAPTTPGSQPSSSTTTPTTSSFIFSTISTPNPTPTTSRSGGIRNTEGSFILGVAMLFVGVFAL